MQTLDRIANKIGSFASAPSAPPAGASSVTYAADMPAAEVTDPTNYLRVDVYADCGTGPRLMQRGSPWRGGPGQAAPRTTWQFDPIHPPLETFGVLQNGTNGVGSPAIAGLTVSYS